MYVESSYIPRVRISEKLRNKVLDPSTGGLLRELGFHGIDTHFHTSESYDVVPCSDTDPMNMYRQSRENGQAFFTPTDHNALHNLTDLEGLVFASEIKIWAIAIGDYKHPHLFEVNAYSANPEHIRNLIQIAAQARNGKTRISWGEFAEYADDNDVWLSWNHASYIKPREMFRKISVRDMGEIAKEFIPKGDRRRSLEGINGSRAKRSNDINLALADEYGIPVIAGSDEHTGLMKQMTYAKGDTFGQWSENVIRGENYIMADHFSLQDLIETIETRKAQLRTADPEMLIKRASEMRYDVPIIDGLMKALLIDAANGKLGNHNDSPLHRLKVIVAKGGLKIAPALATMGFIAPQWYIGSKLRFKDR